MFLKEFGTTEMVKKPAPVFDAAMREPVILTRQGRDGMVLMSKVEYAKLVKAANKG